MKGFSTQQLLSALFSTALLLVDVSAFTTTSAPSSRVSTTTVAKMAVDAAVSEETLDYKTQWNIDDSYTTTDSGLMYKDIVVGTGEVPDFDGGTIQIHYAFWFDSFESATDTTGTLYFDTKNSKNIKLEPLMMQYNDKTQILKGWLEGMKTMKQGGTRVLVIPPELGYGKNILPASPPTYPEIPGDSYLRFEVEMVAVDNSAWTKFRRMVPKPSSILDV